MPEQLIRLKRRLGLADESRDDLLTDLLLEAEGYALAYTGRDFLPRVLERILPELAAVRYNLLGLEGSTSYSEGGISGTIKALPEPVRQLLDGYRLAKVGCP